MSNTIDIHNFSKAMSNMQRLLQNNGVSKRSKYKEPICSKNARLILAYDQTRSFEGVRISTRFHDLNKLLQLARLTTIDFDKASTQDIKDMISLADAKYSPWSRCKLRVTFRRFYKWIKHGDDYTSVADYPKEVRWIKRNLKKRDKQRIQRSDCWDEEEIKKLLAAAISPRDRAFLCLLTETGARIGELGNLHIRDVYQDEFSYLVHLDGKTGERDDRVIYSGPHIAAWLNMHPGKDNPNAALFTTVIGGRPLKYAALARIVKRSVKRAGLSHKRCNPHIFRHSRATQLIEQGWPEPIVKQYFGWEKDSDMLSTYSHLTSRQANKYMLKANGLTKAADTEPKLKVQLCTTCHKDNSPEAKFCERCGRPLNTKTVLAYNQKKKEGYDDLDWLFSKEEYRSVVERLLKEREKDSLKSEALPNRVTT